MANRKPCTLFGFCPELDWKPTAFVGPIPPCRVCASCGHIPMSGLLLPCEDLMCLPCFESDENCPVHGIAYPERELQKTTFSLRYMMQRKVYCWNSSKGCDVVGTLSFMLEHYEKNCPFGAAPTDTEEGPAEIGERHSNPERLTVPGPEQRRQNVHKGERVATPNNESPLEVSDIATSDNFVVESSSISPATSHSIALSTRAGGLGEGVHSSVRVRVDTRSTLNTATRAKRGPRSTGTSRAQQQRAHETTRRAFQNSLEHGQTINVDPVSFKQQMDAEQNLSRPSISSNAAANNENGVFLASGRTTTTTARSKPHQEGTSMMEAASNGTKLPGDAKAAGATSESCPNEPFLNSQLEETQHCESSGALSIERESRSGFSKAIRMDSCGSTQSPVHGGGPSGTPVTALSSSDSGGCHEDSTDDEPPADNSVTVHDHCTTEGTDEAHKYAVSDSSSIASGSSGDCDDPMEDTESNDDAPSSAMHAKQTGYEEYRGVCAAPSEGTRNTAADDTNLQRPPQGSEVGSKATSCDGSAQERHVHSDVAGTLVSFEKVFQETKLTPNLPSVGPAATEEPEFCGTGKERTTTDNAEAFHHTSEGSALEAQLTDALGAPDKAEYATSKFLERALADRRESVDSPVAGGRVECCELEAGALSKTSELPEIGVLISEQRYKCSDDPTRHFDLGSVTQPERYTDTTSAAPEDTTTDEPVMSPGQEEAGLHAGRLSSEHSGHSATPVLVDGSETSPVELMNGPTASFVKDSIEKPAQEGMASRTSGMSETRKLQDFSVFEHRRLFPVAQSSQYCQKKKDLCRTSKNTEDSVPSFTLPEIAVSGTEDERPRKRGTNLSSSESYHADDRNDSKLSNRAHDENTADSPRYHEQSYSDHLSDGASTKLSWGNLQSATGRVGREPAFLGSAITSNSLNFPAIHGKVNEAMETVSKGKHFSRNSDTLQSTNRHGEVILESCQNHLYEDALNSQSSHVGSDQQVQLMGEDQCPEAAAADSSQATQSDCPNGRDAELAFGRSVTGREGRTVPPDEVTIEERVDKLDPAPPRASVMNVSPSLSAESVTRTSSEAPFSTSLSRNLTMSCTQQEWSCTEENRGTKKVVHKVVQRSELIRRSVTLPPPPGLSLSGQLEGTPSPTQFCMSSSEESTNEVTEQSSEDHVPAFLIKRKPEEAANICQDMKSCSRVQEIHQDSNFCGEISPLEKSLNDYEKTKNEPIKVLISTKVALDAVLAATKESLKNPTRHAGDLKELQEAIRRSTCDVVNICKAMLHSSFGNFSSLEWYIINCGEVMNRPNPIEYLSLKSCSPHYFCGYNIQPSIFLRKRKGTIEIHPELTLYKGEYDDFIKWPFEGKCKLVIVHPRDSTENVVVSMGDDERGSVPLAFKKPEGMMNIGVYAQRFHSFQDVENRGFVSNNQLRLRFEVFLPS